MVNKLLDRLTGKGKQLYKGASFTEGLNGKIHIGLNWSGVPKSGNFNKMLGIHAPVDLDGAMAAFKGKELDETISYKNMLSKNGSMRHSGDDQMGDLEGNDGIDNESMTMDLSKMRKEVDSVYVYLRSVQRYDFADIPYSILRILEVIPSKKRTRVIAFFNLSKDPTFKNTHTVVMGKFEKQSEASWSFTAMGEPIPERDFKEISKYISEKIISL